MSRKEDLITKVKTLTGVTGSELTVVFILVSGLLMGLIIQAVQGNADNTKKVNKEIYHLLDSLANASKATYRATDASNNVLDADSNSADIQQQTFFSSSGTANGTKTTKADRLKGSKININDASKVELMKLPGIGEKTAISIIEYRDSRPFGSINEIKNVKGIGVKKFEQMREFIDVK